MSINSETAHLHQSNSQLLLSRTRLVIQSMINLDSCYKEKFMVTWPRAYVEFASALINFGFDTDCCIYSKYTY